MGLVVAFEGVDGSGKTTALRALTQTRPFALWPVVSMRMPTPLLEAEARDEIERLSMAYYRGLVTMRKSMSFIMDRCYVTSIVYSRAFGWPIDMQAIATVAFELRPVIVLMDPPLEVVLARLRGRGDRHLRDEASVVRVWEQYRAWGERNACVKITDGDEPWNIDRIERLAAALVAEVMAPADEAL